MKKIAYVYSIGGPPVDYFFPKLAERGEVVTYVVTPPSDYNRGVIDRFSRQVLDFSDLPPREALEKVEEDARATQPDALFTFAEFILKDVSDMATRLGLRGVGPNVDLARNKVMMRCAWQQAGVPQPKFVAIESIQDVKRVHQLATPFIIKVAYGAGSIGQLVAHSHDEAESHVRRIAELVDKARKTGDHEFSESGQFPLLIAEEIIQSSTLSWYDEPDFGDFVSVEGLVRDGVYYPLAMTGRLKTVPPFTELGNLAPCVLPAEKKARIVDLVRLAVESLALENCATHTELKLMEGEQISFLETAARMGGVGIARELLDVYGIDFVDLFFSVILGEPCDIPFFEATEPRCGAASVAMIGCDTQGRPWTSQRLFDPMQVDWNRLTGGKGQVEILKSQSIVRGAPFPIYDQETGVLNYAGQAYLTCPDFAHLKTVAYQIIDGLESNLPACAPALQAVPTKEVS